MNQKQPAGKLTPEDKQNKPRTKQNNKYERGREKNRKQKTIKP